MAVQETAAGGVKSVMQAVHILDVVARFNGPTPLKDIARRAGVAPSKAHRYLQTLCACGMLSQVARSGAYDLGLSALRLGLAAVNRIDIVNRAGEELLWLVKSADADACLSVWTDIGPTIVRFERSARPTSSMMGAGVSLPVLTSSTGLVFLAFANPERTQEVVRKEAGDDWKNALQQQSDELKSIQRAGFSCAAGALSPGRFSISAPIMSFDDNVVTVVTLVSQDQALTDPDGPSVKLLLEFCRRFSMPKRGYGEETLIEKKIAI